MNLDAICNTKESLDKMPDEPRLFLETLASSIDTNGTEMPYDSKQALWKAMISRGIEIPGDLFESIEKDDSLEMWSADISNKGIMFMFAMGDILKRTSYSVDQLSTLPWPELFERDQKSEDQILAAFGEAMVTFKTVKNVTDWHIVNEKKSLLNFSMQIRVKKIIPFRSQSGICGVFALVKSKPPASIFKSSLQSFKLWLHTRTDLMQKA